ncbi:hypothetical protein OJAV_G00083510 [Oryzias javanicus]|uniref:Uncharacterized protein n=1 Tax=Oryzias javanicus TaxID=123683 RepID=A0A3S2M8E6_ORYJA|nr:hypothetical protein OJAV_G00083510 [Oryzias javanicus]
MTRTSGSDTHVHTEARAERSCVTSRKPRTFSKTKERSSIQPATAETPWLSSGVVWIISWPGPFTRGFPESVCDGELLGSKRTCHHSHRAAVGGLCSVAPALPQHAARGGCRVGAVEHWRRGLRLLPHQRHGGEDTHSGERPLHPPVCHRRPVGRPHPAHDLHPLEETLKPHISLILQDPNDPRGADSSRDQELC